jgi:hypothetical protein
MHEMVTAIGGIVLLITILGSIPYGIWMICSIFNKKWKRVCFQIAIPVAVYTSLAGLSTLSSSKAHADYLAGLYDTEVELGTPLFEYDSDRSFNGDGYSFSVYALPSNIRKRFEAADDRLLKEYPKHPSYRSHWQFERWREAPFDDKFKEYLDFALSSFDEGNASELTEHFAAIRSALQRKGTFYALFYHRPSGHVGDVDFFIVDLSAGLLYSINHNT